MATSGRQTTSSPGGDRDAPRAVDSLVSDMKMYTAYETAADFHEADSMKKAFDCMSWDDSRVLKALPQYLASSGEQKARVDYAFNALYPRPASHTDPKQALMQGWIKARLFYYDSVAPFQFNPYAPTTAAGIATTAAVPK
eukprot:GHVU01047574.1.p1 GENE.GHVU01047574.1~~GHVU01047574.1.p1  ORF type:complete len:140 (-),score=25.73 GHVU01047574.1:411-830(-)